MARTNQEIVFGVFQLGKAVHRPDRRGVLLHSGKKCNSQIQITQGPGGLWIVRDDLAQEV